VSTAPPGSRAAPGLAPLAVAPPAVAPPVEAAAAPAALMASAQAAGLESDRVLALLDDPGAAQVLLEVSSALAQLMQRELQVVYLESAAALAAAELPATQVLAAARGRWGPLAPLDVAQGFAQEAARLRALAEQAALQRAVRWSMRVVRGALPDTTRHLMQQNDLLLVAGVSQRLGLPTAHLRCRAVIALDDGTPASAQALQIATRLTTALGVRLQRQSVVAGSSWALDGPADLLVLPYTLQPMLQLTLQSTQPSTQPFALARHAVAWPAALLVGPAKALARGQGSGA